MFIRKTTTSSVKGKTYFTCRLVKNVRQGKKVSQQTLLNLGRHFPVPEKHWKTLCQRIKEQMQGHDSLLGLPPELELEAQRITFVLLDKMSQATFPDTVSINPELSEARWPRNVGVEHVGLWAWKQSGLPEILRQQGLSRSMRNGIAALLIGRMAHPGSERETYRWLCRDSALGELMGVNFAGMSHMQLYRTSDALMKCRAEVERDLFAHAMSLFELQPTLVLYDLTNTYFEGAVSNQPKAQRGRSKEKRSDSPLLTLGLALDGSGFIRRSEVFAGNISEGNTLANMLQALGAENGALVILDRGISSEANLHWLRAHGYDYLVVHRGQKRSFDATQAVSLTGRSGQRLQLQLERNEEQEEVLVHCYSEARKHQERGILNGFQQRFEAGLRELHEGLSRPRAWRRLDTVWKRIGRLQERSRGASRHYRVEVLEDPKAPGKAQAIHFERQLVEGSVAIHPGVYCLRTSKTDWDEERIWRTYTLLTEVEAVFRSLKTELGLRPVYHRTAIRAEGHLFLTVLAYHLVRIIRLRLGTGESRSWSTLRCVLARQQRQTLVFRDKEGCAYHLRKSSRAEPEQEQIYQALGLPLSPGGVQKRRV